MIYISKEELESPRLAYEVKPWAQAKIMEIRQTKAGRRALHLKNGLLKELSEETLPLGIFCEQYFCDHPNVLIGHKIGS